MSQQDLANELWKMCTSNPLCVTIPNHPITSNHRIARGRHGFYKTARTATWEQQAIHYTRSYANALYGTIDLSPFSGRAMKFEMDLIRKKWTGKVRKGLYVRPDCTNFIKSCEDAVMAALGLDDAAVIEFIARKVEDNVKDETRVTVTFLEGNYG